MGKRKRHYNTWKPAEDAILKTGYESHTPLRVLAPRLRRHTIRAIGMRANRLGVIWRRKPNRLWTKDELRSLTSLRESGSTVENIATKLNRSWTSVWQKMLEVGLTEIPKHAGRRLIYVDLLTNPHTIKQVCQAMNVKPPAVWRMKWKLRRLGYQVLPASGWRCRVISSSQLDTEQQVYLGHSEKSAQHLFFISPEFRMLIGAWIKDRRCPAGLPDFLLDMDMPRQANAAQWAAIEPDRISMIDRNASHGPLPAPGKEFNTPLTASRPVIDLNRWYWYSSCNPLYAHEYPGQYDIESESCTGAILKFLDSCKMNTFDPASDFKHKSIKR